MTKPETPLFPSPIARRVATDAISVTALLPFNLVLTDGEADALIAQLQVARAMPASAIEDAAEAAE